MRWEEVHVKWCLMRNLGAETIVVESIKSQVLHFDDRQGKVPICDVEACARELWTRVSRIFLRCRKETKGLSEKKMFQGRFSKCGNSC